MPNFKNLAYFSVTSISLNDVNVRGGNIIKPLTGEISNGQKCCIIIEDKRKMSPKSMDM